ncbi:ribonuclease E/G [Sphingorhabdus sp.]|jgi:hypothetical protein|uniref:ribonuclease E/G n=1 Tax=Sphingorhabdus sp. TaxID=1902408 RepID=UPI003BAF1844|nr:ribonuclease E/G [Sphingomonadales bacterium]MBK9432035.1 ribonuclease E/G [Sphingomonadales bacterium]
MTRSLLWDAAPGEVRAGLVEDGALVEFRIFRPHRPLFIPGSLYSAKLLYRNGGKTFVEMGRHFEAQLENTPNLPEGAMISVEMVRGPIPEPGRWKHAIVRWAPDVAARADFGLHSPEAPKARFLKHMVQSVETILCADALIARDLQAVLDAGTPAVSIDAAAIADADFDSLIENAVHGEFPIENGMLSIERTRAMTMIDIDGGGDPMLLNLAAALEIPRLLRLLDIGGQIGIDFLNLPDRKARLQVDAALEAACKPLGQHERTAMNGFGFVQIVRPRPGPSIPEILCGTTPGRMTFDSRAVVLLRTAARSVGHGKRQLVAHPSIIELIAQWPDEVAALQASLGVAIELVPDAQLSGYGHVHVSP